MEDMVMLREQNRELQNDLRNALDRVRLLRSFIRRIGGFCASTFVFARHKRDGTVIEEGHLSHDIASWQQQALAADDDLARERERVSLEDFVREAREVTGEPLQ